MTGVDPAAPAASPGAVVMVARRYRWPILAGAAVVALCAVGFWIATLTSGLTFHGTGPTGAPVTITGSAPGPAKLIVFTDRPQVTGECTTSGSYFWFFDHLEGTGATSASLEHDGRTWYEAGVLEDGWAAGHTVSCPAADGTAVLLAVDGAATWRPYALGLTGGGFVLAVGAAIFVLIGRPVRS
ncbi:hypothetical protein [Branchiibius sp. NY16-3462-2]|uniref:hypothetical protein n=1 Tax=Branchiibius sp. NY16-3462-2 TaxID=1807500 RepID=UPI00079574D0|nr:hypothetical protein [Branchiibius sp. NY16-3462-2]KYH45613.1 hypothetical protein AZH51_18000 [Branchiibius sp. NY16-3462-2]